MWPGSLARPVSWGWAWSGFWAGQPVAGVTGTLVAAGPLIAVASGLVSAGAGLQPAEAGGPDGSPPAGWSPATWWPGSQGAACGGACAAVPGEPSHDIACPVAGWCDGSHRGSASGGSAGPQGAAASTGASSALWSPATLWSPG